MRRTARVVCLVLAIGAYGLTFAQVSSDARLEKAFKRPPQNGWTFVHLEGTPAQIGFQHGYLLAHEIADGSQVIQLELPHDTGKAWQFFREAAEKVLWPRIEDQYREELQGIVAGLKAQAVNLDLWDVVAVNAWLELGYYASWYDQKHNLEGRPKGAVPERCSAFLATGRFTRDGKIVMGHNAWTGYADGTRWTIIYDIVPARGHRILMDGYPGIIHSGDDFGINSAGIMITETTISGFAGFKTEGIPEFVRARKAMQYASSIDEFVQIIREGNNGGYANTWLAGDRKTGEIARLELGLKNVTLARTKDGFYGGANFPINPKLARQETSFPVKDRGVSANARHNRWKQLAAEYKGRVDVETGKKFLSDHYDTYAKKEEPNERTLCGHIDLSQRGAKPWQPPYGVAGAIQAKLADSSMAERMSLMVAAGHPCGIHFHAGEHLEAFEAVYLLLYHLARVGVEGRDDGDHRLQDGVDALGPDGDDGVRGAEGQFAFGGIGGEAERGRDNEQGHNDDCEQSQSTH